MEGWKPARSSGALLKRGLDLTLATAFGILALPFIGGIWTLIRLDTKGAALYGARRVARGERTFRLFKFRTMRTEADALLDALLETDPALRHEYAQFRKLRNDPRITRIGRVLRRFSLDELPQLWNVIRGEMSLVGPRPYDPVELALMNGSRAAILSVRPGLTGLWQVSGRNRLTFEERLRLDLDYVQRRSLGFDLRLLLRTFWVVLRGDGAY